MRIRRTLTLLAGPLFAYAGWLGCSAPLPPPAPGPAPAASSAPSAAPVAAPPPPPERPRCRPEIRGQRSAVAETEAALGDFFDRVLAGDDWRVATEARPPDPSLFVAEVQRLKACPRVYDVRYHRTPELSDGILTFDEPELGALRAGFVVRDDGRIVLHLYTVERSFRAGLTRAELEPFLERSPEWIPSGGAACGGSKPDELTAFALFRGPRTNVLCVVRGDASRCFELAASPSGWLYLEITNGERCGIGTNAVVGPDLDLQIVPYRQRRWQRGELIGHVGASPQEGTQWNRPLPRAWTALPSRWHEVDPGRFPIRAVVNGIGEESGEDFGSEAPPTILGSDLRCLRLDGVWRCTARNEDWPPLGPIRTRSGAGGTVASMVSELHEPDADPFEDSRFLTLARGEGRRLVALGRFPIGAEYTHVSHESDGYLTQLVQSWDFTHEEPLCIHVTRARARLQRSRTVGQRFENHESDVAVVYGPAPESIPRRAPRMAPPDPFHPSRPVQDLRGSWRLEGESWRRVASCAAP
jgi:hypothetical protein